MPALLTNTPIGPHVGLGRGDHLVPRCLVGHVEVSIDHRVAEFGGQRSAEIVEHVGRNDSGSSGHEAHGRATRPSPGCTGHHRHDTLE